MKIAATFDNGKIFQHFGKTEQVKVYTVEDGKILSGEVHKIGGDVHCGLADVLSNLGVTTIVCGGIGAGARNAVAAAGLELFAGVQGDADEQVAALLSGGLVFDPDYECDCHDHHDHDCAHSENCSHH